MKRFHISLTILLTAGILLSLAGCYKDKGNYSYDFPQRPEISNLDTLYRVFVGDSLIIHPTVKLNNKQPLSLEWSIQTLNGNLLYRGDTLHILFGLLPARYKCILTVTNNDNAMKYFYEFAVVSQTAFAVGSTVLSDDNGVTQLSFIKPDGTVQAGLYAAINPGEVLPTEPTQVLAIHQAYQAPIKSYWVIGKGGNKGIQVNADQFTKIKTLADNFFDTPDSIHPGKIFTHPLGIISGVVNTTLYAGTNQTWDQAPVYGMFNLGASGDYQLSPEVAFNYSGTYDLGNYVGFDKNRKQFLRFNSYGDLVYFGTSYSVQPPAAFDPTNVGMSLEHLQQINNKRCHAFCRAADNTLYELTFETVFSGPFDFFPLGKRPFAQPALITPTTKWESTADDIIYFSSGEKVYRYNPANEDFRILNTTFQGQQITMLKVIQEDAVLVVGTKNTLTYLDISAGKLGVSLKTITGIPGIPVDLAIREQ